MTLIEAGFVFAAVSMFIIAALLIGKATDPQRLPIRHHKPQAVEPPPHH